MNERIKELAEQAGQIQLATPDNPSADKIMVLIGPNIEKFAELIVRECISQIEKQGNGLTSTEWDEGYRAGLRSAQAATKNILELKKSNTFR